MSITDWATANPITATAIAIGICILIVLAVVMMILVKEKKKVAKTVQQALVIRQEMNDKIHSDIRIRDGTEISCPNCGEKLIWKE
jgi:DNA-directed RNA polymerase subunit RPC12/RpoP